MYPKNNASPEKIPIGPVVQISDGAVQTTGVTVRIIPTGVAEGDGAGTTAYSTDGVVLYTPTQAETNYASFILIAKKTGCIPASILIVTTESAIAGRVSLGAILGTALTEGATGRIAAAWQAAWNVASSVWTSASVNQTGDNYTRLGATVSVVVPAAVAAASTEEDEVVSYRGDYLARSWTNLGDFSAVTEVWFTVKDDPKRADSEAYLQIKRTVGLTYLSQAAAAVADVSKAAITIDDAVTGDITITVDAELMAQLPPAKNWFFDVQIQQPALTKTSTVVAGKWNLKSDVTRAIT